MNLPSCWTVLRGLCACGLAVALTGCGFEAASVVSSEPSAVSVRAVHGLVHGGPNPVTGATVTLYETQVSSSSGYTTAAKVLDTTTTDSNGNFAFSNTGSSAYSCDTTPYMQYAYLVVTGGNSGSGVNSNAVLMAALGSCANMATQSEQDVTEVMVSEATTVASAYALDSFMSVSGNAGAQVVQVGSSAANDATSPACSGVGSAMTCTAGGLGHAFANAAELASAVSFGGPSPTGQFNTTVPSFAGSVIPQALLNVVADVVQACVNSPGAANPGGCTTLFAATTPSGGSAPTDTLSAAMFIAKNPAATSLMGSNGIFNLATPTSFFQPTLAAAPTDYSLAIVFPGGTNFPYAWSLATDIADNVYILAGDTAKTTTLSKTGLAAIGYGGNDQTALLYSYAANSGSDAGYTYTVPGNVVVDAAGNVYASNVGSTGTTNRFRMFNAASGAFVSSFSPSVNGTAVLYPNQMAVDRSNNLWAVTMGQNSNPSAMYEVPTNGTITTYSATSTSGAFRGIAVDANQNVWSCPTGKSNSAPGEFAVFPATNGGAGTTLWATGFAPVKYVPMGAQISVDANNAAYCTNGSSFAQATASIDSNGVVSAAPTVNTYAATPAPVQNVGSEIDGDGHYLQIQGTATGGLIVATSTGTDENFGMSSYTVTPCFPTVTGHSVYCSNNSNASPSFDVTAFPTSMQIDSAGSVWIASGTSSAYSTGYTTSASYVVQLIGAAAPTWPQLSYGHPGARPAAAATSPDVYVQAAEQFLDQLNTVFFQPSQGLYSETVTSSTGAQSAPGFLWTTAYTLHMLYWASRVDPKYLPQLSTVIAATSYYRSGQAYGPSPGAAPYFDDNGQLGSALMDVYLNVLPQPSILTELNIALNFIYNNRDAQGGVPQQLSELGEGKFYLGPVMSLSKSWTNYAAVYNNGAYLTTAENYFTEVNDPALGLIGNKTGLFIDGSDYQNGVWTPYNDGPLASNSTGVASLALALYSATGNSTYLTYAENLTTLALNRWYTPGQGFAQVSVWGGAGIVDVLCELYRADHNIAWYNDAQDIVNFLLDQARDTAGYFPDGTTNTGDWNVVRTGNPPDATVTMLTQAAAASALFQFAYLSMNK